MKKLLLLVVMCFVGMMVPQVVLAADINVSNNLTITIEGNTITIHSNQAGTLASLPLGNNGHGTHAREIKEALAASEGGEIKFVGYFCEDDLKFLKGQKGDNNTDYCKQTIVDMSEAHFVNNGDDANNHTNNYSVMKFQNWGANVTTAITSNYLEASDQVPDQLCDNCTNLQVLTLGSGNFSGYVGLGNNVNSLTTVNVQKDVTSLSNGMFNGRSTITKVTFEDGDKNLTIGSTCFNNCTGITSLALPARLSSLGIQAFANTTGVASFSIPENSRLTTIPEQAFMSCGNATQAEFDITIPRSVTEIQNEAFGDMWRLKEVHFTGQKGDPNLVIKTGAFAGGTATNYILSDVYVEVDPDDRKLICEYNAFSYESMVAQTAVDGPSAILHFKEDDFNFYAGEWKKGMVFTQSNLNAYKDGYSGTVGNHTYVPAPTQNASEINGGYAQIDNNSDGFYHPQNAGENTFYAPGNGWQQFAKTGSEREIYVTGDVYMTYSTAKPYSLPTGIYAFRVINYIPEKVNGVDQKGTMILKMIQEVPVHTGMLLISTDQYIVKNGTDKAKFYFGDPSTNNLTEYPYLSTVGQEKTNLLAPAVHEREVGPVSNEPEPETGRIDVNSRPFTHRNFVMHKDYHIFGRVINCIMPDNRAYLSLPTSMFNNPNEEATEGPSPNNTQAGCELSSYDPTAQSSNGAKPAFIFDYDVEKYGMIWPLAKVIDDNMGITTGISTLQQENAAEGIYSLQGVKVSVPNTKGIYIVNGKKVVFK